MSDSMGRFTSLDYVKMAIYGLGMKLGHGPMQINVY